jgi:cyclopropane fatty-acyl-phospholipid synthase-like methyltransferase
VALPTPGVTHIEEVAVVRYGNADRQPTGSRLDTITAYYDETWFDYQTFWLNRSNLSIHFGYSDATTRHHGAALENMNRVLAERVAIQPGERVLDAGCGVGGSSIWLAENRDAIVVGITPVHRQVLRARAYAARRTLSERVVFEQASYTSTEFSDNSFDVVWALESLCHATDKVAFYREAGRLLRPGGRLIVAEYIRKARGYTEMQERLLYSWLNGWAIPDLDSREEHLSNLAAAGLAQCTCDDVTTHVRPSLHRLYKISTWCYPMAVFLHVIGLRSRVQHGNVKASRYQYQALKHGLWFYGILSAVKP